MSTFVHKPMSTFVLMFAQNHEHERAQGVPFYFLFCLKF